MSSKLLKIIDPLSIMNLPRDHYNLNNNKNSMVGYTGCFLLGGLNSSRVEAELSRLKQITPGHNKHSCPSILATRPDERIISESNSNNSRIASQELVSNKAHSCLNLIVQELRVLSEGSLHMLRPREGK